MRDDDRRQSFKNILENVRTLRRVNSSVAKCLTNRPITSNSFLSQTDLKAEPQKGTCFFFHRPMLSVEINIKERKERTNEVHPLAKAGRFSRREKKRISMTLNASVGNQWRLKYDPVKQLVPAGKVPPPQESVYIELTQSSIRNRPETPPNVKPFRQSFLASIGKSTRHYGLRNDAELDSATIFGHKTVRNDTAEACLKPGVNADKAGALAAENAEKNYASSKREPLGCVPEPPYLIPDKLAREGFGNPSAKSESTKVLIYACPNNEGKQIHPHSEQVDRHYDWAKAKIDPTQHRFGATVTGNPITTKELVHQDYKLHVLPSVVQDFKTTQMPALSLTRNFGFGDRAAGASNTYGKLLDRDEFNARQLITGAGLDAARDENESTLGKPYVKSATQRKQRSQSSNESSFGGSERSFGVPSIRSDIQKPRFEKITNGTNYGDEVPIKQLLYPSNYVRQGVEARYYGTRKSKEEVRAVAEKCGFGLSDAQFEEAFAAVVIDGKACLEEFKNAVQALGY